MLGIFAKSFMTATRTGDGRQRWDAPPGWRREETRPWERRIGK